MVCQNCHTAGRADSFKKILAPEPDRYILTDKDATTPLSDLVTTKSELGEVDDVECRVLEIFL